MTKPKGYYTDKSGKVRPVFGKQPHVKPLSKGTKSLRIPKRTIQKKRVKGFSKLTRATSQAQGTYGHSIVHSPKYQKSVIERMGKTQGEAFLRKEHAFLVKHYLSNHASPLTITKVHTSKDKKQFVPKGFKDLSWLDSVIKDSEKAVTKSKRDQPSKEKQALLKELELIDFYIKNTTPAKRRRTLKKRDEVVAKIRELN